MLFDPARHEPLLDIPWDAGRAQAAIAAIVRDTEAGWSPDTLWPVHPNDLAPGEDPAQPITPLYHGAAGVVWALRHLRDIGAAELRQPWRDALPLLRERNRAWLAASGESAPASYLMGDLPIDLMAFEDDPTPARADALAALLESNIAHPARELMWGAPGALLAASFLHGRTGDARWAGLYRRIAAQLRGELLWSDAHGCHYWLQDLYGRRFTMLDAVHGFVATAHGLIRGRHLLAADEWAFWQATIVETVSRTATREGGGATWRTELIEPADRPKKTLMQFCHGAPGFVICLAKLPTDALDALLLEAGEATWAAGPLTKGANLCHGTGGNGYAFLALHARTGDARWLDRARRFAMHAIAQSEADLAAHGRRRHSLWTGDPGLAIYLHGCLTEQADFPTLDRFFAARATA